MGRRSVGLFYCLILSGCGYYSHSSSYKLFATLSSFCVEPRVVRAAITKNVKENKKKLFKILKHTAWGTVSFLVITFSDHLEVSLLKNFSHYYVVTEFLTSLIGSLMCQRHIGKVSHSSPFYSNTAASKKENECWLRRNQGVNDRRVHMATLSARIWILLILFSQFCRSKQKLLFSSQNESQKMWKHSSLLKRTLLSLRSFTKISSRELSL